MIHVFVVASSLAMRSGLRALLNRGAEVETIGEASSLGELDSLPAGIDVLVLATQDVDAAEVSRLVPPAEAVSVLLLLEGEAGAVPPLAGLPVRAWGILPLDCTAEELLAAVGAVHEGLLVGAPALIEPLLGRMLRVEEGEDDLHLEPLTDRETEVLQLLAQGLANKQIAMALGISEHTVKFHVSAIYAKLGANSRTEAVRIGVRRGWVVL